VPNGKPGDHPLSDILLHGAEIYTGEIRTLIKEIDHLGGRNLLEEADWFEEFSPSRSSKDVNDALKKKLDGILKALKG
jgi:hypothetical protein